VEEKFVIDVTRRLDRVTSSSDQKANLKRCHGFKFAVKTFRSRSRLNNVKSYTMAQTSRHLFLWMAAKVGWNPLPSSFVVARRYNK
jgi:hypothetical protein